MIGKESDPVDAGEKISDFALAVLAKRRSKRGSRCGICDVFVGVSCGAATARYDIIYGN